MLPRTKSAFFESEYRPPPLCRTFNWRARKNVELKGVGTEMKFNFIIGNPPYQEEQVSENFDGSLKNYAPPIYNRFMEECYSISNVVELIHPARFLFNAGSTPKAWNEKKYIKTKFSRALLSVLKVTQNGNKPVWKMIPLQDFTPASDIDWSKSIPEIDQQLYRKYGLDQSEIDFIESHVKEMT